MIFYILSFLVGVILTIFVINKLVPLFGELHIRNNEGKSIFHIDIESDKVIDKLKSGKSKVVFLLVRNDSQE